MNNIIGRSLLVIAVAVLPVLGGEVWSVLQAQDLSTRAVYGEALRMARMVATEQAQVTAGAWQTLATVETARSVGGPGPACDAFLATLLARDPGYVLSLAAGPDGKIECDAGPPGRTAGITGEPWFGQALQTGRALALRPIQVAPGPMLVAAEPWRDREGRIGGVAAVGISLARIAAGLAQLPLPNDAAAVLFTADGSILARRGPAAAWPDPAAAAAALRSAETGGTPVTETIDPAGTRRILAASPLGRAGEGLAVAVALDRSAAFANVGRERRYDLLLLLLAGLVIALAATGIGMQRLVRRPLRRLVKAARAWGNGDLAARTGVLRGPREIRCLAQAFDGMALALHDRERALREALESTTDSVMVLDREWRVTYLNTRAAALLGAAPGLVGSSVWDICSRIRETVLWTVLHDVAATGQPRHFEMLAPALQRLLDIHAYPSEHGITVFFRDITEHRRIEERAATRDGLLRATAEAIPSLVFITDALGGNVYVNRRFQEYTGLPSERLLGDGWRVLLHPDDVARVTAAWAYCVERGTPYEIELRLSDADRAWRWFLVRGAPLRGRRAAIDYWYGVCTGIDEIVAAREAQTRQGEMLERLVEERTAELRAREAQLLQAQKMEAVGQLTGGVAHDFNNLLQAVSGNLELATSSLDRGESVRVRRLLDNASRAIARGARLTGQLLAFSRRQVLRAERVEAQRLVDDMSDLIRRAAGETVAVCTEADPQLWTCHADPAQLQAAVLNLVINARDAMPDGGTLTIALANAPLDPIAAHALEVRPGEYVRVEVTDTGDGMAPEVLERVYEPFFTTKEVGKGSGLGLAQVHGFVRQSGGAVQIDSAPGQGTVVRLFFPRDAAAAEAVPVVELAPARPGHGARVLLVEDDADVLDTLQFAMIDAGFRVVPARDGAEALSVLRSAKQLDLVLSDVVLPGGISGVDVGREARRLRPGLPVLLTSGHAADVLARRAAEAEFELIAKPYPQADLLARLARLAGLGAGLRATG